MNRRVVAACLVVVGTVGAVVGAAAAGWACVPQPLLSMKSSSSGTSGAKVTAVGVSFPGPTELRWNGIDGLLLAKAQGPDFFQEFAIPAARPGLYSVVGVARDEGGNVTGTGSTSFQVTGTAASNTEAAAAKKREAGPTPKNTESASGPVLVLAGIALLVLGGLGGLVVGRRRASPPVAGPAT